MGGVGLSACRGGWLSACQGGCLPVGEVYNVKCWATMLAVKRSAGVAPEVNLRNPLHAGEETCTLALIPGADITRSPKQGCQWPINRTDVLQKNKKKL